MSAPLLHWTPPVGRQTAALKVAGLKTDDLRAAGFKWAKAQRWEAESTEAAAAILARLTGQAANDNTPAVVDGPRDTNPVVDGEAPVCRTQTALEAACLQAGITGPGSDNGIRELQRKADRLAIEAHQSVAGIPGGQPVGSTVDANRRARAVDKMGKAADLLRQADAKMAGLVAKARGLADSLDAAAADGERPRDMNTPKRMAQGMHARLEAAVNRRAAALLRAWANNPERMPTWKPHKEDARKVIRRKLQDVPNGFHSYHVEGPEPRPSTEPTILALRAAFPECMGDGRESPTQRVERLEAAVKFSPIPGFFPTPPSLIARVIELADIREGHIVLEPSAGSGHLAEAAGALGAKIHCCEVVPRLREILTARGLGRVGEDCMAFADEMGAPFYRRIVMNPPFERGQDREHIRRMFDLLLPGGRLVAVCSTGPFHRQAKADQEFRDWLGTIGAEVEDVEPGAFSGSDAFRKTGVSVCLITIDKE